MSLLPFCNVRSEPSGMNEALLLQWKQFCGIFTFLHKEALAILDHKSRTRTKVNKENWPSLASTLVEIVF